MAPSCCAAPRPLVAIVVGPVCASKAGLSSGNCKCKSSIRRRSNYAHHHYNDHQRRQHRHDWEPPADLRHVSIRVESGNEPLPAHQSLAHIPIDRPPQPGAVTQHVPHPQGHVALRQDAGKACSRMSALDPASATTADSSQNAIKRNAHEHERFRRICVTFAQRLHRVDMRMRLGLLQDPAVIDRQIKKEVALAEAKRKEAAAPTVLTEEETKAQEALTEKEREAIKKKAGEKVRPRIRPLSEQKAIEMGANFVAETFIFAVGIGVILVEQWRQRRKAKNARDDIREDLEAVQAELKAVRAELEEFKAKHPEPVSSKLLGFWKGKTEEKKNGSAQNAKPESTVDPAVQPASPEQQPVEKASLAKDLGAHPREA